MTAQQWTVRMADAPLEFETTTLLAGDLLGISAVVIQGEPTHYTAIVQVGDMGCPLEVTPKAFVVLAQLLEGERVRDVRLVIERDEAGKPFDTVHGLYTYEQAKMVAQRVLEKRASSEP
jgi:hypothetical protein